MSPSCTAAKDSPESFGMLLWLLKGELVKMFERDVAVLGVDLRFSQVQALLRLNTLGAMSASELARALGHDAGATTRLLDQLEQRGYLNRKPHEQDRRALRICLTASGAALCRRLNACRKQAMDMALSGLKANERRQLLDYLQRVLATLRQAN